MALVALQQRFRREGGVLETVATKAPHRTLALRALDAEDASASPAEMKDALGPDDAALVDALTLTHCLRDGGYRDILLLLEN